MSPVSAESRPTPRIALVTACRNMRPWIGETIGSVVGQVYPALDYSVVDGASNDGTREWLEANRTGMSHFVSERDEGQYHAIAKGIAFTKGEIMGWLNGDDVLMPWALRTVGRIFAEFPEVQWIIGLPSFLNVMSECVLVSPHAAAYPREFIRNGWFREGLLGYLNQENMFWRRSLWEKAGGFDLKWKWAADYDLWIRFAQHAELVAVATPLAAFRGRGAENRSRQSTAYADEVNLRCASLPAAPLHWRLLAGSGKAGEMLLRLLVRRTAPLVAHALRGDRWQLLRSRRSVSRYDLARLRLERQLRG